MRLLLVFSLLVLFSGSAVAQNAPAQPDALTDPIQSGPMQQDPPAAPAGQSAVPQNPASQNIGASSEATQNSVSPRQGASAEEPTNPLSLTAKLNPNQQLPAYPNGAVVINTQSGINLIFQAATPENLSRSYVKFSGVDLKDDTLIDEFASINLCSVYNQYFDDEFAWRDARKAIRAYIVKNVDSFPEYLAFNSRVQLDRYDFGISAFRLTPESTFMRTGKFNIYSKMRHECVKDTLTRLPVDYSIRLNNPITLDAIPMEENQAYRVLQDMEKTGNKNRVVPVTFFFRLSDFTPVTNNYSGKSVITGADARASLITLRFYEDDEHTKILYEYVPAPINPFD